MNTNKEAVVYLDNISLFLLGVLFFIYPIFTLNLTTEPYVLPKQALLIGLGIIIILLQSIKSLLEKSVKIRRTPFDLPLLIISVVFFASSLFSVNVMDSITGFIPFIFAVISYFLITNVVKNKSSLLFVKFSLVGGGTILSLISILNFFKIFVYPFDFAKIASFSPLGTLLDSSVYLLLVFLVGIIEGIKIFKEKSAKTDTIVFLTASIIILVGLFISIYQLIVQSPIILPFETGFQTAFSAISQDTGRIVQSFFLGSGYNTYIVDFFRFKPPQFNLTPIWMYSFYRSSSLILEILATVGVLGILSFIYLFYTIIKEKPLYVPLILGIIGIFFIPISFMNLSLFLVILGIFASTQGLRHLNKYFDLELEIVALKKGLISFESTEEKKPNKSAALSIISLIIALIFTGFVGYYSYQYTYANISFQKSLVAAAKNNGTQTYQNQVNALKAFSLNDSYQRVFSQTNLALATNLANAVQKSGQKADTQTSQTIYTLIQQSINAARTATTISPKTSINWQNLSSIYRSLIGFGQNADQFAILSAQQAILLDPNDPQLYVNLGGIYYQLGLWDNAIQQFQAAINLKSDLANAYYNLGHSLEQKGDYKNALTQYQVVKSLVGNEKENLARTEEEIKALESKSNVQSEAANKQAATVKQDLQVATPTTQLPTQNPQVKIPAPQVTTVPSPTSSPAPTTAQPSPAL
jgi:tetratricopeptide (TPR) repeat protein